MPQFVRVWNKTLKTCDQYPYQNQLSESVKYRRTWKPVFFRLYNTTVTMEEELTEILDPTLSDDDSKVHNKLLGAVADLYEKKR